MVGLRGERMTVSEVSFERPGLVQDEVYDFLKRQLLEGRLAAGERLREADLAEKLRVSRMPVREALRRLEQEGLLVRHLNRGVHVPELELAQVRVLYEARTVLEGATTRRAAERAGPEQIAELWTLLDEFPTEPDYVAEILGDLAFHQLVAKLGGNAVLEAAVGDVLMRVIQVKYLTRNRSSFSRTKADHAAVAAAIASGDPDEAERVMVAHIDNGLRLVSEHLR